MTTGIIAYTADGKKRAWPNPTPTVPAKVTVNGVDTPFTINSAGEVDVGYVPAEGASVKLIPVSVNPPGQDVRLSQMPLLTQSVLAALAQLYDTGGSQGSGTEAWLAVLDNWLIDNANDPVAVAHREINRAQFMLESSSGWATISAALSARYSWDPTTAALRIQTAKTVARQLQNA